MEAKDTVMIDTDIAYYTTKGESNKGGVGISVGVLKDSCFSNVSHEDIDKNINHIMLAQAEISFKAGFKEALDTVVATREYDEGKQAGIKEVVEWIEAQRISGFTIIEGVGVGIPISEEKWQAKLKEWGVLAP